eukprot:4684144-Amphidinium_carterae.2
MGPVSRVEESARTAGAQGYVPPPSSAASPLWAASSLGQRCDQGGSTGPKIPSASAFPKDVVH